MPRSDTAQLNTRNKFAHMRAQKIARRTGKTTAKVIENALHDHVPDTGSHQVGGLVRQGPVLVRPATDGQHIKLKAANAALDAGRDRER